VPRVDDLGRADLAIAYVEVGRGHPSYLDGIVEQLDRGFPEVRYVVLDVFQASHGLSLAGWRTIQALYRAGARGGTSTRLYDGLRRFAKSNRSDGLISSCLGRDIKRILAGFEGPVVVSHPLLAGILRGRHLVIYQHGELVAPEESWVSGCAGVLVPLPEVIPAFSKAGIPADTIHSTGQCLEPELVSQAETAFRARLERLNGHGPLTIALFSSGAYPSDHVRRLLIAAGVLYDAGLAVMIFAGQSSARQAQVIDYFAKAGTRPETRLDGEGRLKVIGSINRSDENRQVAAVFADLDIFVAPAHERTNWAVGLGLPQFMVCPHIGPYAPLNAGLARQRGVALEIADDSQAAALPETISRLRADGRLTLMAQSGFAPQRCHGFREAARWLAELTGLKQSI